MPEKKLTKEETFIPKEEPEEKPIPIKSIQEGLGSNTAKTKKFYPMPKGKRRTS